LLGEAKRESVIFAFSTPYMLAALETVGRKRLINEQQRFIFTGKRFRKQFGWLLRKAFRWDFPFYSLLFQAGQKKSVRERTHGCDLFRGICERGRFSKP